MTTKTKTREFGLSDEVPEAVLAANLARAEEAWQARSDAAAAAVKMPTNPYRIRGDEEAGAWFVEEATVTRSDRPRADLSYGLGRLMLLRGLYGESAHPEFVRMLAEHNRAEIAALNADRPKAKLEWLKRGRKRKGFFTYGRALAWLREYLEPVREESVYFTAEGREAA